MCVSFARETQPDRVGLFYQLLLVSNNIFKNELSGRVKNVYKCSPFHHQGKLFNLR